MKKNLFIIFVAVFATMINLNATNPINVKCCTTCMFDKNGNEIYSVNELSIFTLDVEYMQFTKEIQGCKKVKYVVDHGNIDEDVDLGFGIDCLDIQLTLTDPNTNQKHKVLMREVYDKLREEYRRYITYYFDNGTRIVYTDVKL